MREKIKSLRGTTTTGNTLERAADVLQDLGKELNKPKDAAPAPVPAPRRMPRPGGCETDPGRGASAAADRAGKHRRPDFASAAPADDHRHHHHFRHLHAAAARGPPEPAHQACRLARSAKNDRGARRRGAAAQSALSHATRTELGLWHRDRNRACGSSASRARCSGASSPASFASCPISAPSSPRCSPWPCRAVDPGWSMLLWTAALFLVVEPIAGHLIEPHRYGHSTGLSPVAVVLPQRSGRRCGARSASSLRRR